jgi:V/A-type H+-transporting ATPase subunit I
MAMDNHAEECIRDLRRLGAVHLHIDTGRPNGGRNQARLDAVEKAQAVALSESKVKKGKKAVPDRSPLALAQAEELAARILSTETRISALQADISRLRGECYRVAAWGDFDPRSLSELADQGFLLSLHDLSADDARALSLNPGCLRIDVDSPKGRQYFAVVRKIGCDLPDGLPAFDMPEAGLAAMKESIKSKEQEIAASKEAMREFAEDAISLERASAMLRSVVAFESAKNGMARAERVSWVTGWIPAAREAELSALATAQGWALTLDDPEEEDQPPTLVTNKAAIRIIQPIFDFLGTTPGYREYEISAWFLVFFSIFFAMIFGDAGYGSILFLVGLIAALRAKAGGAKVPDAVRLLLFLSSLTILWGTVTVSWFGIKPEYLPAFLKLPAIQAIANTNPDQKAAGDNIKLFCFVLGAVQLSIAHIKNLIRDFKSPKMLAQIGFLLEVFGLFWLVLYLVISPERYPLPNYSVYCIGVGFFLVFVFGSWTGKLGSSILESLKNIISIFLGTVSVMADIISYIRLWAVGLAGVAISQTVNGMGEGLFGGGVFLRVLLALTAVPLLFGLGHGLNMVMSVLSVVVHGVRLNLLEFSGHLGMEWSGYKYDPFRVTAEEEK